MADDAPLGIIGGSGFYDLEGLERVQRLHLHTPFGDPSDEVVLGRLGETPIAFIARHGPGHRLSPSEVPYRANIFALASLGVRSLVSISAVGSLREEIAPLHFVVPDQLIDRTAGQRPATFFGDGIVAHVAMDRPYCPNLSLALRNAVAGTGAASHAGGTLLIIEGPQFSSRAESFLYQSWGASIISMTALPEARLAREAGICYACLACVTDYDTWHADHASVTVEVVVQNLHRNVAAAKRTIIALVEGTMPDPNACNCCESLHHAIISDLNVVSADKKRDLAPILSRYGA
jgi:5'-methylthioadenosine phosphorylase